MKTQGYIVTYEQMVEASSPDEAARIAYNAMLDPAGWDVPPVLGVKSADGTETDIDLNEEGTS